MTAPGHPLFRPFFHAATSLAAVALGVLPYPWTIACAALGIFAGFVVIPRTPLEARLKRPGEPFLGGLRTYPLAVLGLVVLLPPLEAAAAWGVLGFGDAGAAVVGGLVPAPSLFGHKKATWSGTPAYVVLGTLGAFGLASAVAAVAPAVGWVTEVGPGPGLPACLLAATAAALVDLVPIPPDDNVPSALAAGGTLWALKTLV